MSLTRNAAGKPKPRGLWFPQFDRPYYFAMREFATALQAQPWEVLQVCLRLAAEEWQSDAGQAHIRQLLRELRQLAPSDVSIPPVVP
jgi:hypothetical protein